MFIFTYFVETKIIFGAEKVGFMALKQIKSKQRVSNHGEVFTAEREVKSMCDLVQNMCEDYSKRFLEPACGNGNFLAEILTRKLNNVKKNYKRSPYDYERFSVFAITSIYGVDILQDNIIECRNRLFNIWNKEYKAICKKEVNEQTIRAVKYILSKNILCGNALTLMCVDENQQDTDIPIIFPEWSIVGGTNLKRRDFRLDVLLKVGEKPQKKQQQSLFDNEDGIDKYLTLNPITGEYLAKPIKEYTGVHYRRINEND